MLGQFLKNEMPLKLEEYSFYNLNPFISYFLTMLFNFFLQIKQLFWEPNERKVIMTVFLFVFLKMDVFWK